MLNQNLPAFAHPSAVSVAIVSESSAEDEEDGDGAGVFCTQVLDAVSHCMPSVALHASIAACFAASASSDVS